MCLARGYLAAMGKIQGFLAPLRMTIFKRFVRGKSSSADEPLGYRDISSRRGGCGVAKKLLEMKPPMMAPKMGASQKSHSWLRAIPRTMRAGPVLRAGLTEVLVMGMLMR